ILGGDIPALTPEIVAWRVRSADPAADLDYIAIERRHMEARFPGARRTYVRLRGLELCGGDINVARIDLATDDEAWNRLLAARKSIWRQTALIGWGTLIRLLLGRLTLEDGAAQVSRRLHLRGRAHLCPYAEAGMDVDKPHQLELLRRDLAAPREAAAAP
ncbi:MAG: NTP transferase domain-containing protein, partial [Anaerolineales bacterium]